MTPTEDDIASEILGPFANTIAHEFNNVLTAVVCSAELIRLALPEGTKEQEHIREILETSESARGFVGRIQSLGRAYRAATQEREACDPIDLAGAVREVLDEQRPPPGIRIAIEAPEPVAVRAPEAQVRTILREVLVNAIEALGDSGAIDVAITQSQGRARIEIRDDGPGLPETLGRAVLAPCRSTKGAGRTGVGLTIAAAWIRAHGGELAIAGGDGAGTCVTLAWPEA